MNFITQCLSRVNPVLPPRRRRETAERRSPRGKPRGQIEAWIRGCDRER